MAFFVVSYDLVKRKDYPELWAEFKRLDSVKCLKSVYFLRAENSDEEIISHFKDFVDGDDQIIVSEFTQRPKTQRPLQGTTAWLDRYFS